MLQLFLYYSEWLNGLFFVFNDIGRISQDHISLLIGLFINQGLIHLLICHTVYCKACIPYSSAVFFSHIYHLLWVCADVVASSKGFAEVIPPTKMYILNELISLIK